MLQTHSDAKLLNFHLSDEKIPFSLSPLKSDYLSNLIIMEQVVGTLVKYGGKGIYESYLAREWRASRDEKVWSFYLYPDLKTEDGYKIDAMSFIAGLKRQLRIYNKTSPPPTFCNLVGWSEFVAGNDNALGLNVASDGAVTLTFSQRPSGLLEFLSMPFYGFYSPSDLDAETWKNEHKIHASGGYSVQEASDFKVVLSARKGWHTLGNMSPDNVEISYSSLEEGRRSSQKYQFFLLKDSRAEPVKGFTKFNSTPTLLTSLVLSPFLPPFDNIDLRNAFKTIARHISENTSGLDMSFKKSDFFYDVFNSYPLQKMPIETALTILKAQGPRKLRVFCQTLTSPEDVKYFDKLLKEISAQTGWQFEFESPESLGKDWMKKAFTNREFPIRIARVDVGGNPENWVIDMMFCSSLGVSFPDAEGKICNIVKRYQDGQYMDIQSYWHDLHVAIHSSSSVIPILRTGLSWMISRSISTDRLSPTMNVPRFDQLELLP